MSEYIDRYDVLHKILCVLERVDQECEGPKDALIMLWNEVDDSLGVPTADVTPMRHGRWIETEQPCGWCEVACAECSECGEDFVLGEYSMADLRSLFRYCPNCGAKMNDELEGESDE